MVLDIKKLQHCSTKESVEKYFELCNVSTPEHKIEYLRQASDTSEFNFFDTENITPQNQYETILAMFLDEEFRFFRGII